MALKSVTVNFHEFTSVDNLDSSCQNLVKEAINAAANAYAPYSGFHVGVALLLSNGEVITGCNQENAAYPSGLCAERVALFQAGARYPGVAVKVMALVATRGGNVVEEPVPPCGACRQVFVETESISGRPFSIIIAGNSKVWYFEKATSLIPLAFGKESL